MPTTTRNTRFNPTPEAIKRAAKRWTVKEQNDGSYLVSLRGHIWFDEDNEGKPTAQVEVPEGAPYEEMILAALYHYQNRQSAYWD